ncbi:MAG TPA: DsrE family protein [Opitutales bacterium]|nr:DsrE family protein [Opitutales bacterium]
MPIPLSFSFFNSDKRKVDTLLVVTWLGIFLFLIPLPAQETTSRLRIVFELTSGDAESLKTLSSNVEGLLENSNNLAIITVVVFDNGVFLLRSGNEEIRKQLAALADDGVDLVACRTSLEDAEISENEIFNFVRTVKVGKKEVERLEKQGSVRIPEGESYVTHL